MNIKISEPKGHLRARLATFAGNSHVVSPVYATLAGMALWPVAQAVGAGDLAVHAHCTGGHRRWCGDQPHRQPASVLEGRNRRLPLPDPGRAVLDAVLAELDVLREAQETLAEVDRLRSAKTLRAELARLGGSPRLET